MKNIFLITLTCCMSSVNAADMDKMDETEKTSNLWFMLSKPAIHPKDIAALQKVFKIKKEKKESTPKEDADS